MRSKKAILNIIVSLLLQIVKLVSGFIFVLRLIVQNVYVKRKYNIRLKDADKIAS